MAKVDFLVEDVRVTIDGPEPSVVQLLQRVLGGFATPKTAAGPELLDEDRLRKLELSVSLLAKRTGHQDIVAGSQ